MNENKEIIGQGQVEKSGSTENAVRTTGQETLRDLQETSVRVPPEIKTWLTQIEMDPSDAKSVTDNNGKTLLSPVMGQNNKTQLPVSRKTFLAGMLKSVGDTGLWLSKYILKMIKKNNGNVKFKKDE